MPEKNILPSAEIRWFFEKDNGHSQTILDWLSLVSGNENTIQPEIRKDFYLKDTRFDTGIKIRPSDKGFNLEMKFLNREKPIREPVKGKMEAYSKWSLPLPDDFNPDLEKDNRFIPVEKERYLVKFSLGEKAVEIVPAANKVLKEGCNTELTRLKLKNRMAFTFGLEAFSAENKEWGNLERTLQYISGLKVSNLVKDAEISCGYMEWLLIKAGADSKLLSP